MQGAREHAAQDAMRGVNHIKVCDSHEHWQRVHVWGTRRRGSDSDAATSPQVSLQRRGQGLRCTQDAPSDNVVCRDDDTRVWLAVVVPPTADDSAAVSAVRVTLLRPCINRDDTPRSVDSAAASNLFLRGAELPNASTILLDDTLHFKRQITAISLNSVTASTHAVDLLLGFASGDVVAHRFSAPVLHSSSSSPPQTSSQSPATLQLNKKRCVASGRVTALRWNSPSVAPVAPAPRLNDLSCWISFSEPAGYLFLMCLSRAEADTALSVETAFTRWPAVSTSSSSLDSDATHSMRSQPLNKPCAVMNPSLQTNPAVIVDLSAPARIQAFSTPVHTKDIADQHSGTATMTFIAAVSRDGALTLVGLRWADAPAPAAASPTQLDALMHMASARCRYGSFLSIDVSVGRQTWWLTAGGEDDAVYLWRLSHKSVNNVPSASTDAACQQWTLELLGGRGQGHDSYVTHTVLDPTASLDLPRLISVSHDCQCIIWQLAPDRSLRLVAKALLGPSPLCSIQILPTIGLLVVSGMRGFVHFFHCGPCPPVTDGAAQDTRKTQSKLSRHSLPISQNE